MSWDAGLGADLPEERAIALSRLRTLRARVMAERPGTATLTEAQLPSVEEICTAIPRRRISSPTTS